MRGFGVDAPAFGLPVLVDMRQRPSRGEIEMTLQHGDGENGRAGDGGQHVHGGEPERIERRHNGDDGGTHGFVVGHISPEAHIGGALALVKNGDHITIDARARLLTLDVPARELAKRRKALKPRPAVKTRGVLAKYADHVSQAHLGAITDGSLE